MTDLRSRLTSFQSLLGRLDDDFHASFDRLCDAVSASVTSGGTILACGNGGSSADASHFVAEFVGRFLKERRAIPAISLSAEVASVTALANDYGYDRVFARQVEAFGRPGDVLIGLTTSGRSSNVLEAFKTARERGLVTAALVGASGLAEPREGLAEPREGLAKPQAEIVLAVPSKVTYEIQEVHMMLLHTLCERVEASL